MPGESAVPFIFGIFSSVILGRSKSNLKVLTQYQRSMVEEDGTGLNTSSNGKIDKDKSLVH